MPLTDVDIFNRALSLLNELTKQVTSITADATPNGKLAALHYESTRDEELRLNKWIFAINRATLVIHAAVGFTNKTGWSYAYTVPTDNLRVIGIYEADASGFVYTVDHSSEIYYRYRQEKGVLYCNVPSQSPNPYVKYIQEVTDPTLFDVNFVEMLTCALAAKICKGVTGDTALKASMLQEYAARLVRARDTNALEAEDDSEAEGESWWTDRR